MDIIQKYNYYLSMPLGIRYQRGKLYPKYVVITGHSMIPPSPHRYYSLVEFIEKYESDEVFRKLVS